MWVPEMCVWGGLSQAFEDGNAQMLSRGAVSLTPSSVGDPGLQKHVKMSPHWPHRLDCPCGVWISCDMPLLGRATLARTPDTPRMSMEEPGQGPQVMAVGPMLGSCQVHPVEVG